MFLSPWFAIAGLAAAAGPIVIHLLNRRRFQVVEWAAMDFLRRAIRRSHRLLRLRDLLLLALRTACVLLFGLAMARPYLQQTSAVVDPDQPVHTVLIVDNSLSMSYQQLNKTLLDEAIAKAEEIIDRLPPGSRISVLPLCGSASEFSLGAYTTKEDAVEALAAIAPVDRAGSASAAIDLALEACRRVTSPPTKQIVFLSDQQTANWPAQSLDVQLKQLPAPFEIVPVRPETTENAWVADFQLQDGIADPDTPAIFLATLRYQGRAARYDVQVTLAVNDMPVATQTVELQPGQSREVRFPVYQFDVPTEPGRPTFVPAEVSIPHDRLPGDDRRFLMVPVVAALPVVFVDQYGADEDPQRNRYGETFRLRRLLTPVTSRGQKERQLVEVRHVKIDQLDRDLLDDARLVVVAGVSDPAVAVSLLREYVAQGGCLMMAAGGRFDPVAWTNAAWLGGLGILPAPLKAEPVGQLPGDASKPLEPFQIDPASLVHEYFLLEHISREEMEDLYRLPYFFKAVVADMSDEVLNGMFRTVTEHIEKQRAALGEINKRLEELTAAQTKGVFTEADRKKRTRLEQERAGLKPRWLLCSPTQDNHEDRTLSPRELAERTRPTVLASFTNRVPLMIRRRIGLGRVLFVSTGVHRSWNTWTTTNAVLVFDRVFRRLLQETLPDRNISSTQRLVVPVAAVERRARFTLQSPDDRAMPVPVDALGPDHYGVTISNLASRGIYRLTAHETNNAGSSGPAFKMWEIPLAVNGPADESELDTLDEAGLAERMGQAEYQWVGGGQLVGLPTGASQGRDLWKWMMLAVLAGLLVELLILAWPALAGERAA